MHVNCKYTHNRMHYRVITKWRLQHWQLLSLQLTIPPRLGPRSMSKDYVLTLVCLTAEDMGPEWNSSQELGDTRRRDIENKAEEGVLFSQVQTCSQHRPLLGLSASTGRDTPRCDSNNNHSLLKVESARGESKPIKLESKGPGKLIHGPPSNPGTWNSRR